MLPTRLIIVIVVLALGALTFGALAIRNRRTEQAMGGPGDQGGPEDPGAPGGADPQIPARPAKSRAGSRNRDIRGCSRAGPDPGGRATFAVPTTPGSGTDYLTVIFTGPADTVPPLSSGSPVG